MRSLKAKRYIETILSDEAPMYIVLTILAGYLGVFAHFKFVQISSIPLDIHALVILIPILVTDVLKTAVESFSKKIIPVPIENLKSVAVVIPTHNGEKTLKATLKSLLKKFKPNSIIVASNGSSDRSAAIAKKLKVKLINIPDPVGKVEAINIAVHKIRKKYTLIMDDDTLIGKAIIPTNLLEKGYNGVAFRVLPVVTNWLTQIQSHEYRKAMDISRGFHNASGSVQTISGAIGLFHTKELQRQIKIHTGEFSGEDLQRTLLIHLMKNNKGVVIADTTVTTVVPTTLWHLFKQRILGWNPGFYANINIYLHILRSKHTSKRLRIETMHTLFLVVILDPIRVLSLPILLFSPTFLIIFYITYVLLDAIPYYRMGCKEPFWVVSVTPFYGLFNFIARFAAGAVFVYRRVTYKYGKFLKFDDYKIAKNHVRFYSITTTSLIFLIIFSLYSYIMVIPTELRQQIDSSVHDYIVNVTID